MPRSRTGIELSIFLWAAIAVGAHVMWAGGARVVTLAEEHLAKQRAEIREMIGDVRKSIAVTEVEIQDLPDVATDEPPTPAVEKELPPLALPTDVVPTDEKLDTPNPPEIAATPETPPEQKKAEEEEEEKPEPEKNKPTEAIFQKDKRIAIRQAVKENQPDNPNAPRVADHANTVEEETQAKLRSNDSVSADPSLAEKRNGPEDDEGNSSRDKIAEAETSAGDSKRAPGEASESHTDHAHHSHEKPAPAPKLATGPQAKTPSEQPPSKAAPAGGSTEQKPAPAVAESPGASGQPSPPVVAGDEGYSQQVPDAGGPGYGSAQGPVVAGQNGTPYVPFSPKNLGLGVDTGAGASLNVPWSGFVKAVGDEQLDAQRAAIGSSIRSEKRGKYDYDKFARWKPDIENYDPSVKVGNQTALNAAQQVGAGYLSTIHNAIHPIFAEEFLALLDNLPKGHALNDNLVTHVEIVLDKDGNVVRMGITQQSGSTMFDASALEAIDRAQPFGKAPTELASTDGLIYLHWEFHRDPVDACSTRNAQPFILKDPKPITNKRPIKKRTLKKSTTPAAEAAPGEKPAQGNSQQGDPKKEAPKQAPAQQPPAQQAPKAAKPKAKK